MARKSAVLTPEGKKAALAQLSNTAKEASINLKNAKGTHALCVKGKAYSTKQYAKDQKLHDANIAKTAKELIRAQTKHEIATKAVLELKATPATPVAKTVVAKPVSTLSSALSTASTTTQ